jgi:hypothetical protein
MEECRLRIFEKRELRRKLRPNEVTDELRKLHNGELHNLYAKAIPVTSRGGP